MYDNPLLLNRRQFLTLSTASIALVGLSPRLSDADVIREMQGNVWVNNLPATSATLIKLGDTIKTGANSRIIFVIGKDAYQLNENSTLRLHWNEQDSTVANSMRLVTGSLLSVFGKGGKREIQMKTATLGVRGTGVFLKVGDDVTNCCACYGEVELITQSAKPHSQQISSTHHTARIISHDLDNPVVLNDEKLEVAKYHSDAELIHLESLVGRQPPASFKSS